MWWSLRGWWPVSRARYGADERCKRQHPCEDDHQPGRRGALGGAELWAAAVDHVSDSGSRVYSRGFLIADNHVPPRVAGAARRGRARAEQGCARAGDEAKDALASPGPNSGGCGYHRGHSSGSESGRQPVERSRDQWTLPSPFRTCCNLYPSAGLGTAPWRQRSIRVFFASSLVGHHGFRRDEEPR